MRTQKSRSITSGGIFQERSSRSRFSLIASIIQRVRFEATREMYAQSPGEISMVMRLTPSTRVTGRPARPACFGVSMPLPFLAALVSRFKFHQRLLMLALIEFLLAFASASIRLSVQQADMLFMIVGSYFNRVADRYAAVKLFAEEDRHLLLCHFIFSLFFVSFTVYSIIHTYVFVKRFTMKIDQFPRSAENS